MKLSASMEKALNEQYVKELYSAYLYLSMSKDMKREGFTGYASWLKVQHDEELEHAFKISDYIEDREGVTEFGAIDAVTQHFDCPCQNSFPTPSAASLSRQEQKAIWKLKYSSSGTLLNR